MMKILLLLLASLGATLGRAQALKVEQLAGPNGAVRDADYGLTFTLPAGWKLTQGTHWGEFEGTLFFNLEALPEAAAAVYYQAYVDTPVHPEGLDAWLRAAAARKAEMRAKEDFPDYRNRPDSFTLRRIEDATALSWVGDFTKDGEKWCECLTHVANAYGHAQYFIRVPAARFAALQPSYLALIATTQLAHAAVVDTLDPHLVAARQHYKARDYPRAVAEFTLAFQVEPGRASDLTNAAGAAAQAGNPTLALTWLRLALTRGGINVDRLLASPDFASLRDTAGWKQFMAPFEERLRGVGTVQDTALAKQLTAILDEDQKYRRQLDDVEKKTGRDSPEMRALWKTIEQADDQNLTAVTKILDERGWVGSATIGSEANSALFLVIQHADIATQQKYLPMMREAVKDGRAQASSLALLEDRVALRTGKKQIYGSQIGREPATGKYYVDALDDPEHVDERRASVGLQPLADYVKHWEIEWNPATYAREQAGREARRAEKK